MRLLLLNINYLRYHFFIKTMQKKIMDFDPLPNGAIFNNIPFTFVNCDLRKILNDKMTPNILIIKILRCHLSFSLLL